VDGVPPQVEVAEGENHGLKVAHPAQGGEEAHAGKEVANEGVAVLLWVEIVVVEDVEAVVVQRLVLLLPEQETLEKATSFLIWPVDKALAGPVLRCLEWQTFTSRLRSQPQRRLPSATHRFRRTSGARAGLGQRTHLNPQNPPPPRSDAVVEYAYARLASAIWFGRGLTAFVRSCRWDAGHDVWCGIVFDKRDSGIGRRGDLGCGQ